MHLNHNYHMQGQASNHVPIGLSSLASIAYGLAAFGKYRSIQELELKFFEYPDSSLSTSSFVDRDELEIQAIEMLDTNPSKIRRCGGEAVLGLLEEKSRVSRVLGWVKERGRGLRGLGLGFWEWGTMEKMERGWWSLRRRERRSAIYFYFFMASRRSMKRWGPKR